MQGRKGAESGDGSCGRFCRCVSWHDGFPSQNVKTVVPVRHAGDDNSKCDLTPWQRTEALTSYTTPNGLFRLDYNSRGKASPEHGTKIT